MPSAFPRARRPRRARHVSRHAAAAVRRGPEWTRLVPRGVTVKGSAAVGLAFGVGAVLVTPTPSAPAVTTLSAASSAALASRTAVPGRASRTAVRATSTARPAISAPVEAAPQSRPAFGVSGFRAVPTAPSGRAAAGPTAYDTLRYAAAARASGLGPNAAAVYSAVRTAFGITNIGGYRPGDSGDHGTGHACDIMITSRAQGDAVAAFVMAHASEFHVTYVIWRQRIWFPGTSSWRPMADRGSITANHYDHVHVSVS